MHSYFFTIDFLTIYLISRVIGGSDFFAISFFCKNMLFFPRKFYRQIFRYRTKNIGLIHCHFVIGIISYTEFSTTHNRSDSQSSEKKRPRLTPSRLRGTYPSRSSILDHHHSRSASSPFRNTTIRSPLSKVSSSWLCASYPNTAYTTPVFMIPSFSWTPADKFKHGFRISRKIITKTITFFLTTTPF